MDKHGDFVCILDSINLDMEDTLDDESNEYVIDDGYKDIYMDYDLAIIISIQLNLTPSNEHNYSYQSLYKDMVAVPIVLDVVPLARHPPFPNVMDQDGEGGGM